MLLRGLGLALANLAAPAIAFLGTPFIARLYAPSAFGEYFFYLSISTLFAAIVTLQLFNGILSSSSARRAAALLCEAIAVTVVLTLLLLLVWIGLWSFDWVDIKWAPLCCLMTLFLGVGYASNFFLIRIGCIQLVSTALICKAILLLALQFSLGYLNYSTAFSLAISFSAAEVVAAFLMLYGVVRYLTFGFGLLPIRGLVETRRNLAFATHFMPSQVLSLSVNYFPVVLLKISGDVVGLGIYSMTLRVVATPVNALSSALRSLYWRFIHKKKALVIKRTLIFYMGGVIASLGFYGAFKVADLHLAELFLGPSWAAVDGYMPAAVLWLLSSLIAVMPAEVVKNTGGQKYILAGEFVSALVKLAAVAFAAFVFMGEYSFIVVWFYAGFAGNVLVSLFYFYVRRHYGAA